MPEQWLKRLEPFALLDRDALSTLARHCRVVRLAAGRRIVRAQQRRDAAHEGARSRRDEWLCYLIEGRVRLERVAARTQSVVSARDEAARRPLFDDAGCVAALTLEPCRVLWVDAAPVAFLLDPRGAAARMDARLHGYRVRWLADDPRPAGWAERFLARGLATAEPGLLSDLFSALRAFSFEDREAVIEEGTLGDEFFIVAAGRVEVRSRSGARALLDEGAGFGEDAILCGGARNASVRMIGRGRLMRLAADDFRALLLPASVRWRAAHAIDGEMRIVDLDAPSNRGADPRARLASAPRGATFAIAGGSRAARTRWTWLAVRAGHEAVAIED